MIAFIFAFYAVSAALFLMFYKGTYKANPIFWYICSLSLISLGTFSLLDLRLDSDLAYVKVLFLALYSFGAGALLTWRALNGSTRYRNFTARPVETDSPGTLLLISIIFLVSVAVTAIYYRAVGYNFVGLLIGGTEIEDYVTMRLEAYAGDRYLGAGYVNQFKNVLLPVCVISMGVNAYVFGRKRLAAIIFLAGTPLLLYAVAGTGQRTFVAYAAVAALFGVVLVTKVRLVSVYTISAFGLVLSAFIVSTVAYLWDEKQQGSVLWFALERIFERFVTDNQLSGVVGFRYIYNLDTVWFYEWYEDLRGILPGVDGSRLANIIHGVMYGGSERGTSPLTLPGSAYHNGGLFAVFSFHFISGVIYAYLYVRFLSGNRKISRSIGYGALFFYLSINVIGSLSTALDNGVVTLVLMLVLLKTRFSSAGAKCARCNPVVR